MSYEIYNMRCIDSSSEVKFNTDGIILMSTSEERAYCVAERLIEIKGMPTNILILYFDDKNKEIADNYFNKKGYNILFCKISLTLSDSLIHCLKLIDEFIKDKNMIAIDITCIPIPIFAQIINQIYNEKKSLVAYYTQPGHYNLDKLFDFSAYEGEISIENIPGYDGTSIKRGEIRNTLFYQIGFEVKYISSQIKDYVMPNEIVPINGFPSYFPKYKDISLINNDQNFYADSIEIIYSEACNPFDSFNNLVKLKNKYSNDCISVLLSSTKPMALGACLFALKNTQNNIRLLFPYPSDYNVKQSSGKGIVWEYKI